MTKVPPLMKELMQRSFGAQILQIATSDSDVVDRARAVVRLVRSVRTRGLDEADIVAELSLNIVLAFEHAKRKSAELKEVMKQ